MAPRLFQSKYLVWAVALAFAVGVALLIYMLTGFRLGTRTGSEKVSNAITALALGIASQAGLVLAPVVRSRGLWLRSAATALMVPAFVFGVVAYRDVFFQPAEVSSPTIAHPIVLLYLSIVPVYVAAVVWLWRAPQPSRQAPPSE